MSIQSSHWINPCKSQQPQVCPASRGTQKYYMGWHRITRHLGRSTAQGRFFAHSYIRTGTDRPGRAWSPLTGDIPAPSGHSPVPCALGWPCISGETGQGHTGVQPDTSCDCEPLRPHTVSTARKQQLSSSHCPTALSLL